MSNISMVEAKLPPGFRFHPSDEELVCDYLMKKVAHSDSSLMIDLDLNKCEPWDIPERACVGGKEWYFYTQRDRKYATGERRNRATGAGYWKATGKDRAVLQKGTLVGMRKTLVFYQGRAPRGTKTHWVMHEFRLHPPMLPSPTTSSTKEDWVLCRTFYKNKEEIGKGSMGIRCYQEDTGTFSLPQPHLMGSYITFDSPPPHHTHQHEQVSCFSNNIFQTNPKNNNITTFHPISTMDHPVSAPKNNTIHDATTTTTTTYHPASSNSYSHSLALDPFSCDTKVLKAVLTQLTKMETNPVSQKGSEVVISHNNHSETYLSQMPIPNLWNNY